MIYNAVLDTKAATQSQVLIALERVQSSNARAINYRYKQLGAGLKRDLSALDHVPDTDELSTLVYSYDGFQQRVLQDSYARIADEVLPLITGDNALLKESHAVLERKAEDDIQPNLDTELYKLRIMDYIRRQTGVHITRIDSTTLEQVQRLMATTSTTQDFQTAIDDYFRHDWPTRSYTIARTESHSAAMTSVDTSVRLTQVDRPKRKTWRVTYVSTRSTHMAMNGVEVDDTALFEVPRADGGIDYMAYPGDSSHGAGAGNVINCRCHVGYRYAD